jgi:hypothetical protein
VKIPNNGIAAPEAMRLRRVIVGVAAVTMMSSRSALHHQRMFRFR